MTFFYQHYYINVTKLLSCKMSENIILSNYLSNAGRIWSYGKTYSQITPYFDGLYITKRY